jgi:hypothetical protein
MTTVFAPFLLKSLNNKSDAGGLEYLSDVALSVFLDFVFGAV